MEHRWPINLEIDGYPCNDSNYQDRLHASGGGTSSIEDDVKARLNTLYSNLIQRLLYAIAETELGLNDLAQAAVYEHWSKQLIVAAGRCLVPEEEDAREFRQSLNRVSGGIMLSRLARNGVRIGLYTEGAAKEARLTAIQALINARPILRKHEERETKPEGMLRIRASDWQVHRRAAEYEILDLQAQLTR